ncbi:MAG: hypothetical protein KGJ35_00800 [Patescibacteria group bacterium]|nr:hypothetical protein [Patescibacteria group bacterium]
MDHSLVRMELASITIIVWYSRSMMALSIQNRSAHMMMCIEKEKPRRLIST